jgi:hypothetical protein
VCARPKTSVKLRPVLVGLALLLAVVLGGAFLLNSESKPFRTVASLDYTAYAANALSLRGNTYRLEGVVDDAILWSPSMGRLISLSGSGANRLVPVLITPEFGGFNVQKGQTLTLLVEVDDKGLLRSKSIRKS